MTNTISSKKKKPKRIQKNKTKFQTKNNTKLKSWLTHSGLHPHPSNPQKSLVFLCKFWLGKKKKNKTHRKPPTIELAKTTKQTLLPYMEHLPVHSTYWTQYIMQSSCPLMLLYCKILAISLQAPEKPLRAIFDGCANRYVCILEQRESSPVELRSLSILFIYFSALCSTMSGIRQSSNIDVTENTSCIWLP